MTVRVYGKLHLLNAEFGRRLLNYAEDVGVSLHVYSGHRSFEEQARLYDLYLRGLGNLAARPGLSFHNHNGAVDCRHADGVRPGDTAARRAAVVRNGLVLAVPGEPWHLQPAGFSKARCSAGPLIQGNADLTRGPPREIILIVQTQLIALGYDLGSTGADGFWGNLSQAAMRDLKHKYANATGDLIPIDATIGPDTSTKAIAWAYDAMEQPVPPPPPPPPPRRLEQAVVTTASDFDAPHGRALASLYNWAHVILPAAHDIGHAIVVGAAANQPVLAESRTVLTGTTRVETAQAVLQFVAEVPPGTENRAGDPRPSAVE